MKKFNDFDKINEKVSPISMGYYVVKDNFEITPGGGWRITFKKGEVLKMNLNDKLERYLPIKQEWKIVAPPISGMDVFVLHNFSGGEYMYKKFLENVKSITKNEANEIINGLSKEIVIKVKDFERTVRDLGLTPNQEIKIIL